MSGHFVEEHLLVGADQGAYTFVLVIGIHLKVKIIKNNLKSMVSVVQSNSQIFPQSVHHW